VIGPVLAASRLTAGGITFLLLAWGGITGLTVFCFYRLIPTRERRPSR
jgi:hypothetical protein